ncbi:membrane protein, partial [Pseudomonas syringae pv. actinidiae ICMP 19094]
KPLPKDGQWARLPKLKTRSYTLRQLYDGYVYVFDETAGTLHEYAASASDGHLSHPFCCIHATTACTSPFLPCNGRGECASTCAPTPQAARCG